MSQSKIIALLFTVIAFFTLPSCQSTATPREAVDALYEKEIAPPACKKYYSDARVGSPEYLSPEILSAAYGITDSFDGLISAAICTSPSGRPCEFAVFYCKSRAAAEDVALFCRGRIDTIKRNAAASAVFVGISLEDYMSYINNAAVIISGRWVALIISSDTPSAQKILYKLL